MKWLPRLSEPPALTAYRAANLADVAATGTAAKAAWNRLRDDPAYKQVQSALFAAQQGLCAYCEQRLTTTETGEVLKLDQQVEHVLPKSGGAGRTLDATNLVLCCGGGCFSHTKDKTRHLAGKNNVSCGQTKGDLELGRGCDPRDFPLLYSIVDIRLDGTLVAEPTACTKAGISPADLDRTINDILNLNCDRLRSAREKVLNDVRLVIVDCLKYATAGRRLPQEKINQAFLGLIECRLCPDLHGHLSAFWTTERKYLEPLADSWITNNAHLFGWSDTKAHENDV